MRFFFFFFFRSWTKTKKCQHKSQIFPLCLASVVPHLRYCLFSFCYHSHSLLGLSFPTGSPEWILWFLWFGCSLLLLLERWPQQNNRNTAENQCKQKKEEVSHPKSHISCVLPVQYFSYNLCEKLKSFLWTTYVFWKRSHFSCKPRPLELHQFQAIISGEGCHHTPIHSRWMLAAYLLRENIYEIWTVFYFLKINK